MKLVQIATLPETEASHPQIVALDDDQNLWVGILGTKDNKTPTVIWFPLNDPE